MSSRTVSPQPRPAALALGLALLYICVAAPLRAEPWLAPGDQWVRGDLQRLSDAGVITSPITSWPLSWGSLAMDINAFRDTASLDQGDLMALSRVRRLMRENLRTGEVNRTVELRAAENPQRIRRYDDTPRGELESWAELDWTGRRFAGRLRVGLVDDPLDDRDFRLDGTYGGVVLGNWMLSAGWQERFWGPGWGGSLILGNAARPVPSIAIQRNYAMPFETRWLSWLGPWSLSAFAGQLDSGRDDVSRPRLIGGRFSFRPLEDLEIGVSRTAQWCGQDRPCNLTSLRRMAFGYSNRGADGITRENDPGNQLAGFDLRWNSPVGELPYALYGQFIGEDEAGYMPSQYLGMIGAEVRGRIDTLGGNWRLFAETADTTCSFYRSSDKTFRCAYRHGIYTDGYRHREQPIGYGTDSDARVHTLGLSIRQDNGNDWSLAARYGRLNRATPSDETNVVTPVPANLTDVEAQFRRDYSFGEVHAGVGWQRLGERASDVSQSDFSAFAGWRRAF